jgi:hypothetical protein
MKMEKCFETSAYKIQKPWNYPEESIQRGSYFHGARACLRGGDASDAASPVDTSLRGNRIVVSDKKITFFALN